MFDFLKLKPKEKPVLLTKNWRAGMWVMLNNEPHILYKLDTPCELHKVDKSTGETVAVVLSDLGALRQADYDEIPSVRMKLTKEQAKEKGYAS